MLLQSCLQLQQSLMAQLVPALTAAHAAVDALVTSSVACQATTNSPTGDHHQQQLQCPPLSLLLPQQQWVAANSAIHQLTAAAAAVAAAAATPSFGLSHAAGPAALAGTGLQWGSSSSISCRHSRSFCVAAAVSPVAESGLAHSDTMQAGTCQSTSDADVLGLQQRLQPQQQQAQQPHALQHPRQQQQLPGPPSDPAASLREASKQRTRHIMAAQSPQQLLQVLQQHSDCMDGYNVTAAFTRSKALCYPDNGQRLLPDAPSVAELLQALQQLAAIVAVQGDQRQLANIIWASGYLRLPGVVQLLLPRMLQHVEDWTARHLSTALYGMARAGVALSQEQMQQLLAAFCARLPEAQPQSISNTLWATVSLQHRPSPEQLQQMLDRFVEQCEHANGQEIGHVVWSIAVMQQRFPPAQLQLLLDRYVLLLPDAKPQEISNLLCTAATIQQQIPSAQFLLMVERFTQLLPTATCVSVKEVVWAAAKLQKQLPARQRQLLLARFTEQLPTVQRAQEISNTLWAVATMGLRMPARQLRRCLDRFLQLLPGADSQAIKDVTWAVATMQQLDPRGRGTLHRMLTEQDLTALADAFTQRLPSATPQRVFIMLWACSELRFHPQQLLQELRHHASELLAAGPHELNVLAHALGSLGYKDDVFPGVLLDAAQDCPGRMGSRTLACMCWAAAMLDMQAHVPHVLRLAAACSEPEAWETLPAPNIIQLYQVHRWLELGGLASGGLSGALTAEQLQQCRAAWQQQAAQESQASQMQQQVFAALGRLPPDMWQQQPALEQHTPDGDSVIDIAAVTAAGTRLAIEVDGPSHFLQPGDRLTGPTQARNRALAAAGYRVVSISGFEWLGLTKQQQEEYLLAKLEGC